MTNEEIIAELRKSLKTLNNEVWSDEDWNKLVDDFEKAVTERARAEGNEAEKDSKPFEDADAFEAGRRAERIDQMQIRREQVRKLFVDIEKCYYTGINSKPSEGEHIQKTFKFVFASDIEALKKKHFNREMAINMFLENWLKKRR